jgi:hypothetical protein
MNVVHKPAAVFKNIPLFTLRKRENRILYAISDVVNYYIGFRCKQDDIDFKVYFREVNNANAAYSLKFFNDVRIHMGASYAIALNTRVTDEALDIRTLYQDKMIRFSCISTKDKKDYVFIVKNPKNSLEDEYA